MQGNWLTRRAILRIKNVELEETYSIVIAYSPGELRTFTSEDTEENENVNMLRYPKEMLNTISPR